MKHGFQYHAYATGVAGRLIHPFDHTIEALAPSALAPHGGYSSGRSTNYRLREILSFRSASTQVSGAYSEDTKSWDTVMTCTVEGLEILGALKAELVVARLASRHKINEAVPSIIPLGSRIEGLQVAGVPVTVQLHADLYSELDTYEKLAAAYRQDSRFREEYNDAQFVGREHAIPEEHHHHFPWIKHKATKEIPNHGDLLSTSLVSKLVHTSRAIQTYGHVIYVPQFGTVSIGALTVDGKARRLTMIRVDLGCAACGTVSACSGETNGKPMPPPVGHTT